MENTSLTLDDLRTHAIWVWIEDGVRSRYCTAELSEIGVVDSDAVILHGVVSTSAGQLEVGVGVRCMDLSPYLLQFFQEGGDQLVNLTLAGTDADDYTRLLRLLDAPPELNSIAVELNFPRVPGLGHQLVVVERPRFARDHA